MSKIASLTVVNQQGTRLFSIGMEVNNLKLNEIKDESECDNESFYCSVYRGYTESREIVFETINAPITVEYMEG